MRKGRKKRKNSRRGKKNQYNDAESILSEYQNKQLSSTSTTNALGKKSKKLGKKKEYNPILNISTVFGKEHSSLHSIKTTLCIETLKAGYLDSFNEIFNLSHREPILIDPVAEKYFVISSERLEFLSNLLKKSEDYRREGKFDEFYTIYQQICNYLEKEKDYQTALYFHKKAKKIIKKSSNDSKILSKAYENRGLLHGRLGKYEEAMKSHEKQVSLLEGLLEKDKDNERIVEELKKAKEQLVEVYLKISKQIQKESQEFKTSIFYLEKCLELCKKEDKSKQNTKLIIRICYSLGKVFEKSEDFSNAIEYQKKCLFLADEIGDLEAGIKAEKNIGKLVEKSKDYDLALETYKQFLKRAEDAKKNENIGKSCEKIGRILIIKKKFNESLPYFEKNYKLAKESKNVSWMEKARIGLGFAKGNSKMSEFINIMQKNDINSIINFKLK